MTANFQSIVLVGGVLLAAVGCATHEEWATWREHPTHFASTEHMTFSMKNRDKSPTPVVSRTNIASARAEGWWGKPLTVPQEQILER